MSKTLLWFNPKLLINSENSDAAWHRAWYKLSQKNICLVDGTNISKKYGNNIDMNYIVETVLDHKPEHRSYENGKYWHNNFDELIKKISDSVFDKITPETELRISYSGGTDSCLTLAGLLSNSRIKPWLDSKKFVVYTTMFAKLEDSLIWDRLLSMNVPLRLLDYDSLNTDTSNFFMVTGDGDGYGTWWQMMFDKTLSDITFSDEEIFIDSYESKKEKLQKWFLYREPSGLCWDFFNELMTTSPDKIENLEQAWSWFENSMAIQCYMFRSCSYGIGDVKITPRSNWFWFMCDTDFSDMCEYESRNKLYTSDNLFKYQCLKYISNWMGWTDVKLKNKFYSQIKVPKIFRKNLIYSDYTYSDQSKL
jgi:hypothetical protein